MAQREGYTLLGHDLGIEVGLSLSVRRCQADDHRDSGFGSIVIETVGSDDVHEDSGDEDTGFLSTLLTILTTPPAVSHTFSASVQRSVASRSTTHSDSRDMCS